MAPEFWAAQQYSPICAVTPLQRHDCVTGDWQLVMLVEQAEICCPQVVSHTEEVYPICTLGSKTFGYPAGIWNCPGVVWRMAWQLFWNMPLSPGFPSQQQPNTQALSSVQSV